MGVQEEKRPLFSGFELEDQREALKLIHRLRVPSKRSTCGGADVFRSAASERPAISSQSSSSYRPRKGEIDDNAVDAVAAK